MIWLACVVSRSVRPASAVHSPYRRAGSTDRRTGSLDRRCTTVDTALPITVDEAKAFVASYLDNSKGAATVEQAWAMFTVAHAEDLGHARVGGQFGLHRLR